MTKENLIDEIKRYCREITIANDCFELYKTIKNAWNTRLDEMNNSPAFFQIVEHVLIDNVIMTMAKLFDRDCNAKTIRKLICLCESHQELFPKNRKVDVFNWVGHPEKEPDFGLIEIDIKKVLEDAKLRLRELQRIAENLKTRRDRLHAHNDKKYWHDAGQLAYDAPLCGDDIDMLLKFSSDLCNTLLLDIADMTYHTQSSNIHDLMIILDKLHDKNTE